MKTRIPCEYTDEALCVFKKPRKGLIVGESIDKECWWVKWNGNKYPQAYAKIFIQKRLKNGKGKSNT